MVQINFAKREVQCKVVYYGPARSGKTTNLRSIHERAPERVRGQLTTIATDTNRTLFFDFLPLDLGVLAGIRAKVHLYAIPYITGQNAMRVLVLEGVDGIVFVADAAPHRLERNKEAFENLRENLAQLGRDVADIPIVWQWNKTDLPDAMGEADLGQALNPKGQPAFPAAAEAGTGVFTTLKSMTHAVLADVSKMMVPASEVAPPAESAAEPATAPAETSIPAVSMPAPRPPPRPAPAPAPALPPLRAPDPEPDAAPSPALVPPATPALPMEPTPAPEPEAEPAPVAAEAPKTGPIIQPAHEWRPVSFDPTPEPAPEPEPEPEPATEPEPEVEVEADPDTESRPMLDTVPVPVPTAAYEPLSLPPAAEETPTLVPPWRQSVAAASATPEPAGEPEPGAALEFELTPEFAGEAEPVAAEAETYPEPFTDLASEETDPDPRTADNRPLPHTPRPPPVLKPIRQDHWDTPPQTTAPLPSVPTEAYREPSYAEPEYEEPAYEDPGHFAPTPETAERFVSVGGRTAQLAPEVIHGWDEPVRPRRRLAREARPVVDRRKAPRADETLQDVPVSHLAAGAAFGLFSLIAIGYLVHVLL